MCRGEKEGRNFRFRTESSVSSPDSNRTLTLASTRPTHIGFFFAIAVDSIECWLLPLLYGDKKAAKTTGCLESANRALRKANENALSAGEKKFLPAYEKASSGYRKRKTLIELHGKNPSLELFIKRLDTLQIG